MSIKNYSILAAIIVSATLSANALAEKPSAQAGTAARSKPVAEPKANKETGRRLNRRVDITIVPVVQESVGRTENPDAGGERPATKPGAKTR